MKQCCNYNCGQGDNCPFRQERALTPIERFGFLLLGLMWAMVTVAAMTGAKP